MQQIKLHACSFLSFARKDIPFRLVTNSDSWLHVALITTGIPQNPHTPWSTFSHNYYPVSPQICIHFMFCSLLISIQGVHLLKGRILFHNLHLQVIDITCHHLYTSKFLSVLPFIIIFQKRYFFMYSNQCSVPPINHSQSGHLLHKQLQTYMQWGRLLQVSKHAT